MEEVGKREFLRGGGRGREVGWAVELFKERGGEGEKFFG